MAKRPTIKCDPYGQGGKPLSQIEATRLLATVDDKWVLEYDHNVDIIEGNETQAIKPTVDTPPYALTREFLHPDYLSATRFLIKMAAVAQVQDHFPCSLSVERRIIRKQWQVLSKIVCRTTVLKGLSQHDFHLAMVCTRTRFLNKVLLIHGDFQTNHAFALHVLPFSHLIHNR